jgi:hypothetical protein
MPEYWEKYIPLNCTFIKKEYRKNKKSYLFLNCSEHGEIALREDTLKNTGCKYCTKEKTKLIYDKK